MNKTSLSLTTRPKTPPPVLRVVLRCAVAGWAAATLMACGQKGALVLPADAASSAPPAASAPAPK